MTIAIASAIGAHTHAHDWQPDAIVSISSPPHRPLPQVTDEQPKPWHHLKLQFHDIETAAHRHRRGPALAHIEAFIAFLAEHAPRRLLIHCRAGLSRSPAFAIVAMLERRHADPITALAQAAPDAQPNRLALALAEQHYGITGLVSRADRTFTYARAEWGAVGGALPGIVGMPHVE